MKAFVNFLFLLFIFQAFDISHSQPKKYRRSSCKALNGRPIVGVLTQEVTGKLVEYYGNHYSYVASSYVKHLEGAGCRVIPIWIDKDKEYYRSILSLINGRASNLTLSEITCHKLSFDFDNGQGSDNLNEGSGLYALGIPESNHLSGENFVSVGSVPIVENERKEASGAHSSLFQITLVHGHRCGSSVNYPIRSRVLFPGGATLFNVTRGYAEAGKFIMEVANEFNNQGDYFPIWGTCLGFELMGYIENNMEEIRVDCQSNNQALPLKFKPDFLNSRLFGEAPCDVVLTLKSVNSTINFHQYCITEQGMKEAGLLETWKILSVNTDEKGLEFISTMEHITKPYYAVQFHPEKPAFEWKASHATPHDAASIRANQYFADFFVQQARLNCHKFPSETEERKYLIYNFRTTYGIPESSFTQLYFFD